MSLRQLLDDEYALIRALRPKAVFQFRLTLARWAEFLGREPVLTDLAPLPVQAFLASRLKTVSQATALKDRVHICAIWNHAAKERKVEKFPNLPPMRAPKRIPRAYRIEEVSAVLRITRALPGAVCGLPRCLYWPSMIRMAYETAERIGAIRQLAWTEVDLDSRYVVFRAESRKGGGRDIQRDISGELASWLRDLKACGNLLVFPWTRSETLLWHEFKKFCVVAEVTPRGFHGFRRTSASYLAAAGGDASAHLGHSSPQMTQTHYLDPSIVRPKTSAVDLLPLLDLGTGAEAAFVPEEDGGQSGQGAA